MTIRIEIEAHPDKGDMGEQINRAMSALGFYRGAADVLMNRNLVKAAEAAADRYDGLGAVMGEPVPAAIVEAAEKLEEAAQQAAAPEGEPKRTPALDKRPVGSPADGNKRRNSAEKAEDDEFERLAEQKGIALDKVNAGIAQVGRVEAKAQLAALDVADKQVDETPAISTGEERIGPEDEQDAADEAAETAKTGLAPIDVLRRLLGDYQKKHGMPAAVKLCQEGGLIGAPIHELDDAGIEAAIARMQGDVTEDVNAEQRAKAEEKLAPKTKADLVDAMMRYGDKYDGTREQAKMTHTLADMPVLFADLFGPEVTKLSQVPEDGYARAVAAIEAAIADDRFGRAN